MADIRISDLPPASAAAGTQEIPVADSGTTKKVTVAQLTPRLDQVLDPTANKTFSSLPNQGVQFDSLDATGETAPLAVGATHLPNRLFEVGRASSGGLINFKAITGDFYNFSQLLLIQAESNDGSGDINFTGAEISVFVPSAGTAMGDVTGVQILGTASGATTNLHGLLVGNITGATNNYAIKTGAGRISIGGLSSFANNAAAISAGLAAGDLYIVSSTDPAQIAIVT